MFNGKVEYFQWGGRSMFNGKVEYFQWGGRVYVRYLLIIIGI